MTQNYLILTNLHIYRVTIDYQRMTYYQSILDYSKSLTVSKFEGLIIMNQKGLNLNFLQLISLI